MSRLPWYAVTISPLRVLVVLAGSAVWLCMLWFVLVFPVADPFGVIGALGWVAALFLAIVFAPDAPWGLLNPSFTIGKPKPPRPPKATAREVQR